MSVDDLIAAFGQFGFDWRSGLVNEVAKLRLLGFLYRQGERFGLSPEAASLLLSAGEETVELVPSRDYNAFLQPPLSPKYFLTSVTRRNYTPRLRFMCASDHIEFNEDE